MARYSSVLGGRELLLVPTVYLGIGLIEKFLIASSNSSRPGVSGSHVRTAHRKYEGGMSISSDPLCLPQGICTSPQSGLEITGVTSSVSLLLSSAFSIVLLSTPRVRRALISFVAES